MESFRPYWIRHPHQLRVFSLLMMVLAPVLCPLIGMWGARYEIGEAIEGIYSELWQGLTHRIPTKPIVRPALRIVWRVVRFIGPLALYIAALSPMQGPTWAFIAICVAFMLEGATSEARGLRNGRKNARSVAGSDEHAENAV